MPEADKWNFAYVLPGNPEDPKRIVVPSALQMGWCESPSFFHAASETARDVAAELIQEPMGPCSPHPLEHWMVDPKKGPDNTLATTCEAFKTMLEVYVNDFCSMVQTTNITHLQHVSRKILHAIHDVFPPPALTGHNSGDPVSEKKLLQGDGISDMRKEILILFFDKNLAMHRASHSKAGSNCPRTQGSNPTAVHTIKTI